MEPSDYSVATDTQLQNVVRWFLEQDPDGLRFKKRINEGVNAILTAFLEERVSSLSSPEKTAIGTSVEKRLRREFALAAGPHGHLDFLIDGAEIDCKYSIHPKRWMIPPEAVGKLCLGISSDDDLHTFSVGAFRADPAVLSSEAGNRDKKRSLLVSGYDRIVWLWQDESLP